MQRLLLNLHLALEGVFDNRLRAILTALGIVFGVAAVIAMLAIGNGAKQAITDQMKLIGSNNIVIASEMPEEDDMEQADNNQQNKTPWSPGLTLADAQAVKTLIPSVQKVSPEVVLPMQTMYKSKHLKTRCIGTTNAFFELNNISIKKGTLFHQQQIEKGLPVCIIGQNVQTRLFSGQNPIGQTLKCGKTWLRVIGVLEQREANAEKLKNLGIRNYNDDIYVPINTALLRFKNRALVNASKLGESDNDEKAVNYHQLDRIVIQVSDVNLLRPTRNVLARMLNRRHREVLDYQIQVPELIIEAQQKNQELFNVVLAAIAGISLLVGGIGIMNIMLASVLERIKEIGVRRSLGATRQDIVQQFLLESILISLSGGILGILLGVAGAHLIARSADIPTIVTTWSVLLSFGVAASIGLLFGLIPARKAARQDPIKALRTD